MTSYVLVHIYHMIRIYIFRLQDSRCFLQVFIKIETGSLDFGYFQLEHLEQRYHELRYFKVKYYIFSVYHICSRTYHLHRRTKEPPKGHPLNEIRPVRSRSTRVQGSTSPVVTDWRTTSRNESSTGPQAVLCPFSEPFKFWKFIC